MHTGQYLLHFVGHFAHLYRGGIHLAAVIQKVGIHAENPNETALHIHRKRQSEQSALMLAYHSNIGKIEPFDKRQQALAMPCVSVRRIDRWFKGSTEPEKVGCNHANVDGSDYGIILRYR